MDLVLLEKAKSIDRCIAQVWRYYRGHEAAFETDFMRQDAIVLNFERACQTAVDMRLRVGRLRRLPPPNETKQQFQILGDAGLIEASLVQAMQAMVGFRNVAVHEYHKLDLAKVRAIIEHRLDDLATFSKAMIAADPSV